jgi:hypothetical protein
MNNAQRSSVLLVLLGITLGTASPTHASEPHSFSCEDSHSRETLAPSRARSFERIDPSALSPNADFPYLTVKIGQTENYDRPEDKIRLENARRLMEAALNSEALKQKVLAHTWNGKPQFLWNQGKSNEEVYDSIRNALEVDFGQEPFVAEFNNRHYYMGNGVVGSVAIGNPWINTNTYYIRDDSSFTDADLAGHLAHEWLHLLNYRHGRRSPHKGTVPYDVGYMVAEIATQIMAQ